MAGATSGDISEHIPRSLTDHYIPLSTMNGAEKKQTFELCLGIVYVNRTPPPAPLDEGFRAAEDPIIVMDFHQDYEAGAWRQLGRGLTLEEMWLSSELSLGQQFMCVVSSAVEPQPIERIERKTILDAAATVDVAVAYFRRTAGARRHPLLAALYRGVFGHCIALADADPTGTRFAFSDPWPDRSLLCKENNAAGVEASLLGKTTLHFADGGTAEINMWQVSREELERVLVALLIPITEWAKLAT